MIEVKTNSGFDCKISENALDDAEILEVFCELDEGNPTHIFKAVKKLLGAEQKDALYEHLRTEDGRVPISSVSAELADIINKVSDIKK